MGFIVNTKRSKLFNEFTAEEQKKYFSITTKKFIPHVDTLYYSVFIKGDMASSKNDMEHIPVGVLEMLEFLECARERFNNMEDMFENEYWFNYEKSLLFSKRRFSIYDFCIRKEGFYDIFISKYLPNDNTPRVVVQLRSIGLWGIGEYDLVEESFGVVKDLLADYGLEVERTQENRIDFCYHTNIIQNPELMYNDDSLSKNLHTTFSIYSKVGRKHGRNLTVEYLSLGQRSSNNVFFRSYNKTREVIEQNYKDFFIELWYDYGLINYYDYYVYTYAFKKKSYNAIYWGMLEFYLEHGSDKVILESFQYIKEHSKDYTTDELKEIVLSVCPRCTLVINIEFQVMRKFFYSFDKAIDLVAPAVSKDIKNHEVFRIFQILENRKLFLNYLTSYTVAFKKDVSKVEEKELIANDPECIYLDFWKRLRKVKLDCNCKERLYRSYSKQVNKDLLISRIKSSLASLSLYNDDWDTDINSDMSNLICILNDNDMKYNDDGTVSIIDEDYNRLKEKKKKALKSILKQSRPSDIKKFKK